MSKTVKPGINMLISSDAMLINSMDEKMLEITDDLDGYDVAPNAETLTNTQLNEMNDNLKMK